MVDSSLEPVARLEALVTQEGDFITRSLRNMGVYGGELDDCVQRVFLVLARRLQDVEVGKERAFLFRCAKHEALHFRRSLARKKEVAEEAAPERSSPEMEPDRLMEQKRYREMLDEILETMNEELRSVFVLYSFEELTMAEIATTLELPSGTVASRLRRAREIFREGLLKIREQQSRLGNKQRESA